MLDPRRPPVGPPPLRFGPLFTPALRLAAELCARGRWSRPRAWRESPEELARNADEDAGARGPLLFYAAAIARDRGLHDLADQLLARGLETVPEPSEWRQEFELQRVLATALLDREPAAARAALDRLPPYPTAPAYPLLAHAAVLAAERRLDEARDALRRWHEARRASPQGVHQWRTGNAWALEILGPWLGAGAEPADASGLHRVHHGWAVRIVFCLVGLIFVAGFSALSEGVIRGVKEVTSTRGTPGPLIVVLALFGAIVAFGISLLVRGVRGYSRYRPSRPGATAGAPSRLREHLPPLAYPCALLIAGWIGAGSLRSFAVRAGPEWTCVPWQLLAIWLVWYGHIIVHEAGHAVAGAALGGSVREIAVGRLVLQRWLERWRVGVHRELPGLSGHVQVAFPGRYARLRHVLMVAAGPAATLALTALLGWAIRAGDHPPVLERLLWTGLGVGVVLFVLDATRETWNDLRILRDVLRGTFWYLDTGTQLGWHLARADRARDWRVEAAAIEADARRTGERTGWALLLAAARALDGGDACVARPLLEELAADAAREGHVRMEARLQLALVAALVDRDAPRARSWIEQSSPGAGEYAKLAEAAASLAEGDVVRSRAELAEWSLAAERTGLAVAVRVGNHWAIERVEAGIRAAGRAGGSGQQPSDGADVEAA